MTVKEFYEEIHGDYDKVYEIFQSDDTILRFLNILKNDNQFNLLKEALENHDDQAAFRAIHNMKGSWLTMQLGEISATILALTESLRNGRDEKVDELFPILQSQYQHLMYQLEQL